MYTFFVFLIWLAGMSVLSSFSGFEDVWNRTHWATVVSISRRLNMELDLQSLHVFGLHVDIGWYPADPPPPAFGLIYDDAIGQPR